MKKMILFGLLVCLLALQAGPVLADEKQQMGSDPMAMFRPVTAAEESAFLAKLELSEDQLARLKQINTKYRADVGTLASKYRNARQDLLAAIQKNDPSSNLITKKMKEVHEMHTKVVDKEVDYWKAVAEVFTQEQAAEFWTAFAKSRLTTKQTVDS